MADESGKNKGFGFVEFVSFEDSEAAEKTVDELNGKGSFNTSIQEVHLLFLYGKPYYNF